MSRKDPGVNTVDNDYKDGEASIRRSGSVSSFSTCSTASAAASAESIEEQYVYITHHDEEAVDTAESRCDQQAVADVAVLGSPATPVPDIDQSEASPVNNANDDDDNSYDFLEEAPRNTGIADEQVPEKIVVYSLDADGCFLPRVTKRCSHVSFLEKNEVFYADLNAQIQSGNQKTVFLSGSARQSWVRDLLGMFQVSGRGACSVTESYFYALKKAVDEFNEKLPAGKHVLLDQFLLDDLSYDREVGESFRSALAQYAEEWSLFINSDEVLTKEKNIYPDIQPGYFQGKSKELFRKMMGSISDSNSDGKAHFSEHPGKFALLYTQLHYIASTYSNGAEMEFHFYDDRLDILWPLVAAFSHVTDLIPKGMKLCFHRYISGVEQKNPETGKAILKEIKGTGLIDRHYRKTFSEMADLLDSAQSPEGLFLRHGNPLDIFFEISSYGQTSQYQFLAPVVCAQSKPIFDEFNARRTERMREVKTPSLSQFALESLSFFNRASSPTQFLLERIQSEPQSQRQLLKSCINSYDCLP